MAKPLTAKERLFVAEYLLDVDPKRAAIAAGYSKTMAATKAYQWVSKSKVKPNVFEAIQEAMGKRAKKIEIDSDYVLFAIHDTVERCRQVKPVLDRAGEPVLVETREGKIVPAYSFDASNSLKGLELLGKHLRLFQDSKPADDESYASAFNKLIDRLPS